MTDDPSAQRQRPRSRGLDPQTEERFAAVEDFRARADSWMKEITTQVARLASTSEGDAKKRDAVDKRINDLEQRIQSLLTLTEMISANENPFVNQGGDKNQASASGASGGPSSVSQNVYVGGTPGQGEAPAGLAHQTPMIEIPSSAAPSPAAAPAPHAKQPDAVDAEAPTTITPEARQAPPTTAEPVKSPAPRDEAPTASPGHDAAPEPVEADDDDPELHVTAFDDPRSENAATRDMMPPAAASKPMSPVIPERGATTRPAASAPSIAHEPHGPTAPVPEASKGSAEDAAQRILLLEWARMLAKTIPHNQIPGFLDHYVEAGYVERSLARRAQALAYGMDADDPHAIDEEGLHKAHLRTTVLLSYMDGCPVDPATALDTFQRAHSVLEGDWLA